MKMNSLDEIVMTKIRTRRSKIKELESEIMQLKYELNDSKLINRLPPEVMGLILKKLDLDQAFECGKVCRKWSQYLGALRAQPLIIAKKRDRKPRRWFFSNEPCDSDTTIVRRTLNDESEGSFFVNLKQLKIINLFEKPGKLLLTDFKLLNRMTRLEVLEITEINIADEAKEEKANHSLVTPTVTLPNLKQLAISRLRSKIKLNTPNLSSYRSQKLKNVSFVFPEKMTHLYFDYSYDLKILREFKNLQYLFINNSDCNYLTEGELIGNHPILNELSIGPQLSGGREETDMSALIQLLGEKLVSGRNELKIVFRGALFGSLEELEEARLKNDAEQEEVDDEEDDWKDTIRMEDETSLEEWISVNHDRLYTKELRWIKEIDYCSLERSLIQVGKAFCESVFKDFHLKFDQINRVVVDDSLDDEGRTIDFLTNYGEKLTSLVVVLGGLSDDFIWNCLPSTCPEIYSLTIRAHGEDDPNNDINSLLKFENLYRFETDMRLMRKDGAYGEYRDQDIVLQLFEKFGTFHITFKHARGGGSVRTVAIKKEDEHSKFKLYYENTFFFKYEQLSSVIAEIY